MNTSRNRILNACLLLIFLAFAGNAFYGQTNDNPIDKQIDQLFSGYNSTTPGVAVAVVKDKIRRERAVARMVVAAS